MKLTSLIQTEYSDISAMQELSLKTKDSPMRIKMNSTFCEWLSLINSKGIWKQGTTAFFYRTLGIIQGNKIACGIEDISAFCFDLLEYESAEHFTYAGTFLSALIRLYEEKNTNVQTYYLYTEHLVKNLDFIGDENLESEIIIHGNAGYSLGQKMRSGFITVLGNCGDCAGYGMQAGTLKVQNAGERLGFYATGGKIIVQKNAGKNVGDNLEGARIELFGTYESLSDKMQSGRITHKGKILFDKW